MTCASLRKEFLHAYSGTRTDGTAERFLHMFVLYIFFFELQMATRQQDRSYDATPCFCEPCGMTFGTFSWKT